MPLHDKKKFFFSPLFVFVVLLLILGAVIWPLSNNFLKRKQVDAEIFELQTEIGRLDNSNNDLKKLLSYLKSDQFAEAQARLSFGLKKPGEEVVVVKSEDNLKALVGYNGDEKELSNPAKWLKYFLRIN
ncbi:MAG: septum formation initiator family protein [Patescibacteria group bacterium]|jgi:cell division protein FtsB